MISEGESPDAKTMLSTSFAAERETVPFSTREINSARCPGSTLDSEIPIAASFRRACSSPLVQFAACFGSAFEATSS